MARSKLTDTAGNDLVEDSGSILWTLVKGEQLEFEVKLDFVDDVRTAYNYEAVLIEGANSEGQSSAPSYVNDTAEQTRLSVRVPELVGEYDEETTYYYNDVVYVVDEKTSTITYYKLLAGEAVGIPVINTYYWSTTDLQTLYVQFPSNVINNWSVQPIIGSPVYGFFELRVTEKGSTNGRTNVDSFRRTWKPVRGMVGFMYSPTDVVPDDLTPVSSKIFLVLSDDLAVTETTSGV